MILFCDSLNERLCGDWLANPPILIYCVNGWIKPVLRTNAFWPTLYLAAAAGVGVRDTFRNRLKNAQKLARNS